MKRILFFILIFNQITFAQINSYIDKEKNFNGFIKYDNTKVYSSESFESKVLDTLYKNDTINVIGILTYNNKLDLNSFAIVKNRNYLGYVLFGYIKNKNDFSHFHSSIKKDKIKQDSINKVKDSIETKKKEKELALYSLKKREEIIKKCHYYKNEKDDFTGDHKKFTETYNLEDISTSMYGEVRIELRRLNNSKYLWIHLNRDLGCAISYKGRQSYVKFKLENNQIVSFYHFGDTDCGEFSIIANLTKSDIYKLKNSPIKSIRFSGTDYYHDVKNIEWKTFFIDKLNCIN